MHLALKIFIFPIYMVLLMLLVLIITLNTKTLRIKYSFDSLPILMGLYIFHVYFSLAVMQGGIFLLGPTTFLLAPIVINCYKMQIIGVTGGVGSGKSTVSKLLNEDFKLPLIDCDKLARRVVEVGRPAYKKVVDAFGTKILDSKTQEIDRKALGAIVFDDNNLRRKLTRITGLYISLEIFKEIYLLSRSQQEPIVLDAPLLFESKYLRWICFPIIVVDVDDEKLQLKRIVARDKCSQEDALKKLKSQMPISKKLKMADIKLINNGEIADLKNSLINQLYPYII